MQPKEFTTAAVVKITGFSSRQLDYWMQQDIIVPSVRRSNGPGKYRLYSFSDLVQLRFIKRLKEHGWSTQKIRKAIVKLREVMNSEDVLQKAVLISGRNTILAICKTKEGEKILLDALDPSGQQVMWIILESLVDETKNATVAAQAEELTVDD
jgi:DNA-binding transcriptional MerR regulator